MQADVAGFDQQHERGGGQKPERGGDGMDMNDCGYGRLFMEVVVQIKTKADAHEDLEVGEPDERSAAVATRRPSCGCMKVHPLIRQKTENDAFGDASIFAPCTGVCYLPVPPTVILSNLISGPRDEALLIGLNWTSYHPMDTIEAIP
jgi:hypothetical protein